MNPNQIPQIESIFLELTNACNLHCQFCPSDRQTRSRTIMPKELAVRLLHEVHDLGLEGHLLFHVMGEPMLHPDFFEILELNQEITGIPPEILTNGLVITPDVINRLQQFPLKQLTLSWQAIDESTFRKYRGPTSQFTYQDYYRQIMPLLTAAFRGRLQSPLEIDIMVTRYDHSMGIYIVESLDQARCFVNELYDRLRNNIPDLAPFPKVEIFHLSGHNVLTLSAHVNLRFRPIHPFTGFDESVERQATTEHFCHLPFYQLVVLADGRVTMCCLDYDGQIGLGHVRDSSLADIWFSEKALKIREKFLIGENIPALCRRCQKITKKRNRFHSRYRYYLDKWHFFLLKNS